MPNKSPDSDFQQNMADSLLSTGNLEWNDRDVSTDSISIPFPDFDEEVNQEFASLAEDNSEVLADEGDDATIIVERLEPEAEADLCSFSSVIDPRYGDYPWWRKYADPIWQSEEAKAIARSNSITSINLLRLKQYQRDFPYDLETLETDEVVEFKPLGPPKKKKLLGPREKTMIEPVNGEVVGTQILDRYPDRNPNENKFPHHSPSRYTLEIENCYDLCRKRLDLFIQFYSLRGGIFKSEFSYSHGSVSHIILTMILSGEFDPQQNETLMEFSRVWTNAIGRSRDYQFLDGKFLIETGLTSQIDRLSYTFAEEAADPKPFPMPYGVKFESCYSQRLRIHAAVAQHYREKEAAGKAGTVEAFRALRDPPDLDGIDMKPEWFMISHSISKKRFIEILINDRASTSLDYPLRLCWDEISAYDGEEITAANFDQFSESTSYLIHCLLSWTANTLKIPMTMDAARSQALVRLDALCNSNVVQKSKKSKFFGKKGKGKGKEIAHSEPSGSGQHGTPYIIGPFASGGLGGS